MMHQMIHHTGIIITSLHQSRCEKMGYPVYPLLSNLGAVDFSKVYSIIRILEDKLEGGNYTWIESKIFWRISSRRLD